MTKAVYDSDADNYVDANNGGLDADVSAQTGLVYLTAGVFSAKAIGTDVQAYDADLTTWAGVTPSANGQSLVSAANYAAMRGLLDLESGTDFNAYDADLTTYAGITPSANVQTLLGAATFAAFRSSLTLDTGDGPTFDHLHITKGTYYTEVDDGNSSTADTMLAKLSSVSTIAAVPLVTSVPVMPMATPMSALLSAGASFTPSPVMAATWPLAFKASTIFTL